MASGLTGQGDAGLKESEKLPLVPPNLILGSLTEKDATSSWTVIGTHARQSQALMSLAHAAFIAKREGLSNKKFESLGRDDACKGMKVAAAFTAIHSGLCGYFEPDPKEVIKHSDGGVIYKGKHAVPAPPGYTSEVDALDPLYPVAGGVGRDWRTYYGIDKHAQDTRDMLQSEMDEAMKAAIQSQQTDGWLMTYCTTDMVSKALTLMVAAKSNWYATNHHVGQGHATNFITKIAGTMCPFMQANENSISETAKSTVWEIGHWVSTNLCMNLMAMRTGARVSAHPSGSSVGTAILADDLKIRCDAAPAGMAKAALLHSVIKLHHKNMLWLVAPSFDTVLDCAHEYQRFLNDVKTAKETRSVDPRMKSHEGRVYLTG